MTLHRWGELFHKVNIDVKWRTHPVIEKQDGSI